MAVYGVTIFLSALLLFQVQLVIAKYILPWFGGTPAVWTTCMLFFQVLLLAGYAYAHLVVTRLKPRLQGYVHAVVVAASVAMLAEQLSLWQTPILPGPGWKPTSGDFPILHILTVLTVGVGLPFFVLSTSSSLLQAWCSRAMPGRPVYRLYALSNAGSLLALVTYPFVVEPQLPLRWQAAGWAGLYTMYAALCVWLALRATKAGTLEPTLPNAGSQVPNLPSGQAGPAVDSSYVEPTRLVRTLWFLLPAAGSVLLLATTNAMCEDIAVVPLLWVLPLALYLLSFIICFDRPAWYHRAAFTTAAVVAVGLLVAVIAGAFKNLNLAGPIAAFALVLFACCMICHGETARLKPPTRHLTAFYLTVAAGGAAGGLFVGVVAPNLFSRLWEFYIGLFLTGLGLGLAMLRDRSSCLYGRRRWYWRYTTVLVIVALAIGPLGLVAHGMSGTLRLVRNFYGILRVTDYNPHNKEVKATTLYHGRILHGLQYRDPALRNKPTEYYAVDSGVGLAILNHPARALGPDGRGHMRVGIVGLGAGTLAAYGRPGDVYRFYDINPAVVTFSYGPRRVFTFIEDSPATVDVVMGDARLSLEHQEPQDFDVLALDAFSGDAVPVHLLTLEAFEGYLRHLRPGGVLAVHVSNLYLDLGRVVQTAAERLGLASGLVERPSHSEQDWGSGWVLVTRDELFFEIPAIQEAAVRPEPGTALARPWTDDYSNLLEVLR
jgi:SAM-dependent methyltransferase